MNKPTPHVEQIENVRVGMPFMHPNAAKAFRALREKVIKEAGFDFLSVLGDMMRAAGFQSSKDGVANRSWHKTGRAFDYNQGDPHLDVVREDRNGKTYFRTFLKKADGAKYDFTAAAESLGFKRIPAWTGWLNHWNRREFWHYQYDEGLTWDGAMRQIYQPEDQLPQKVKVWGLNDRGETVRQIQSALSSLGILPSNEVDGVFGAMSHKAVIQFQVKNKLNADGLVGPLTYDALIKAAAKG